MKGIFIITLECAGTTIRNTPGFVIESTADPRERRELNLIFTILTQHFHMNIYGLQYTNKSGQPRFIYDKMNVDADCYGWFITREKMKFNNKESIMLTKSNCDIEDGYFMSIDCGGLTVSPCHDVQSCTFRFPL